MVSTVDIYSLGMLAFYVLTNSNPAPNESQFTLFSENLREKLDKGYVYNWKCLPGYLCETILKATQPAPLNRMPLDVFIQNLDTALKMYLDRELPNTHPLILLEIKERLGDCSDYVISDFGRKISLDYTVFSKRVNLSTTSQRSEIILSVTIERYASDSDKRGGISKYLRGLADKAKKHTNTKIFRTCKVENLNSSAFIHMEAVLPKMIGLQYIEAISSNILEVRRYFGSQEK